MIPTPLTSHLDFKNVYEPAEDSFLLLDALQSELDYIQTTLKPALCLELGSGSGVISTGLSSVLGNSCFFLCCDINLDACRATAETKTRNNVAHHIDVIQCDLLCGLDLRAKVDLVVCNPPYVATTDTEYQQSLGDKDVKAAWAGGEFGRGMTDVLIAALPDILTPNGAAYVVLEQCNQPEKVSEFADGQGLNHSIVIKRRAGRELLSVMKLSLK